MKLSVIVTGVTGMVGEGGMYERLLHPDVERVLAYPCISVHWNRRDWPVNYLKLPY